MRSKSVVVIAIVFQFLGSVVASAADAPKGYRDLPWAASPGKYLKKEPAPYAADVALYRPRPGNALAPLYEVPVAEEVYSFKQGRFISASAWLDGKDNFDKIKTALMEAYGQPAVVDEHKHLRIWQWPDSPVEVRLSFNDKFARATVTYVNTRLDAQK
jgi:hypothetical protein